jgi:hypothetical protein
LLLRAVEEVRGGVEQGAAGCPERGLLIAERLGDRVSEAVPPAGVTCEGEHPLVERGTRVCRIEEAAAERLQFVAAVDERGLEQALTVGEVAVQRAGADARATRDVIERGVRAVLREGLARHSHDRLVIAPCIGAHGPRRCGSIHAHSNSNRLNLSTALDKAETVSVSSTQTKQETLSGYEITPAGPGAPV